MPFDGAPTAASGPAGDFTPYANRTRYLPPGPHVETFLREVRARQSAQHGAWAFGVTAVVHRSGDLVELRGFGVHQEERGHGSALLAALTELAAAHGVALYLQARPAKGCRFTRDQLIAWYGCRGFAPCGHQEPADRLWCPAPPARP